MTSVSCLDAGSIRCSGGRLVLSFGNAWDRAHYTLPKGASQSLFIPYFQVSNTLQLLHCLDPITSHTCEWMDMQERSGCVDQGGAAEFVGRQLDERLREHLRLRNNLLNESSVGLAASLQRPLLCLFDRNFELSVVPASLRLLHLIEDPAV